MAAVNVVFPWSTWPSGIATSGKRYDAVGNEQTNGSDVHVRFVTRELLGISSFSDWEGVRRYFILEGTLPDPPALNSVSELSGTCL